jgi:hypothetical protein
MNAATFAQPNAALPGFADLEIRIRHEESNTVANPQVKIRKFRETRLIQ